MGLGWIDDQVIELAKRQDRVIITQDLDVGAYYRQSAPGSFGVIVIRLADQTVESVNRVLDRFFRLEATNLPLEHAVIILVRDRTRIVT